jgi:hypothetical protein
MKNWSASLAAATVLALLVLSACAPPSVDESIAAAKNEQVTLSVENDLVRGQAIFVNEEGERIDIAASDDDGMARCVEATDIIVIEGGSSARAASHRRIKAVVIGRRHDGRPGIWQITTKNEVEPVEMPTGKKSASLPDSDDVGGKIGGLFGWSYTPVAGEIGRDGELFVVGVAENLEGRRIWRWTIEAGTTVGVYWTLRLTDDGGYVIATLARVVGVPFSWQGWNKKEISTAVTSPKGDCVNYRLWSILTSLRLFFLAWYDNYLTDLPGFTSIHEKELEEKDPGKEIEKEVVKKVTKTTTKDVLTYDPVQDAYIVIGFDKDAAMVEATIPAIGLITFAPHEEDEPPLPTFDYERLYIETYDAYDGLNTPWSNADTKIALFDSAGSLLGNLADVPEGFEVLDYDAGLNAGTYYVQISGTSGEYGIRALTLGEEDVVEDPVLEKKPPVMDPYEEPDSNPPWDGVTVAELPLGSTGLYRVLGPTPDDVDYMMIVLPPLP